MNGVIPVDWGWEYVWTAYGATVAVFIAHIASILVRYARERRRA